jgi:acetoin utilization deacetylase AcuC-like enzyme
VKVLWSPRHAGHNPATEIEHGRSVATRECPERVDLIRAALAGDPSRFEFTSPTEHGLAPIEAVHDPGLVRFLERAWVDLHHDLGPEVVGETFLSPWLREGMEAAPERPQATAQAQLGRWCWETNTPLVEGTYAAARSAVDVALSAAEVVVNGEAVAYGLCRPPGHHAPRAAYGGFCFFNNAAVVAHHLAGVTGGRVTVLDVDYHHGNGTQQIFYARDDVQYVSLHGDPLRAYPYYAGFAEETGTGPGRGTTHNVPLPAQLPDEAYHTELARALEAVDAFDPGVLVVSLGVDTFHLDPISDLGLTQDGFEECGRLVGGLARPTVVLQEGGYHLATLGENVRRWLVGVQSALASVL